MRIARPPALPDPERGPAGAPPLPRGVLQLASAALGARLFVARSIRKEMDNPRPCRVVIHCPPNRLFRDLCDAAKRGNPEQRYGDTRPIVAGSQAPFRDPFPVPVLPAQAQ